MAGYVWYKYIMYMWATSAWPELPLSPWKKYISMVDKVTKYSHSYHSNNISLYLAWQQCISILGMATMSQVSMAIRYFHSGHSKKLSPWLSWQQCISTIVMLTISQVVMAIRYLQSNHSNTISSWLLWQ